MKRVVSTSMILSVVFAASMAAAYPVELDYVTVDPGNVVTIGGLLSGNVYAGNYVVAIQGVGQFSGYCVDPSYAPPDYMPYDIRLIEEGSRYEAAAWILAHGYTGNSDTAAQLAVWELVFDWGAVNLAAGNLTYSGSYAGEVLSIISAAQAGIAAGFDQSGYRLAVSPTVGDFFHVNYQDYIIPTGNLSINPVPIPTAIWLLGSGFIGLVAIRRRFAK